MTITPFYKIIAHAIPDVNNKYGRRQSRTRRIIRLMPHAGIIPAVTALREKIGHMVKIEVEVRNKDELMQAFFPPPAVTAYFWSALIPGRVFLVSVTAAFESPQSITHLCAAVAMPDIC